MTSFTIGVVCVKHSSMRCHATRLSRVALVGLLVLACPTLAQEEEDDSQSVAEELAFGAEGARSATLTRCDQRYPLTQLASSAAPAVVELNESNFEHLTQAATGATSGDWLVLFCKESVTRCAKVLSNWQKVAVTLAASREAKGMPRINVASVDTSTSSWLRKRFGIQSVPVVLLFKGGVMYSFHGGGFSVNRLVQFAERDYERSNRMLVPPEPHVATPHDQTFLMTIGAVAVGAAVLWVVDQGLFRYYDYQKRKAKAAKKQAGKDVAAAAAPASDE